MMYPDFESRIFVVGFEEPENPGKYIVCMCVYLGWVVCMCVYLGWVVCMCV